METYYNTVGHNTIVPYERERDASRVNRLRAVRDVTNGD